MKNTTILVSIEIRDRLNELKHNLEYDSINKVISYLLSVYKKNKLKGTL